MAARLPEAVEPIEGWGRRPLAADVARLPEQPMEARLLEAVEPVEGWTRNPVAADIARLSEQAMEARLPEAVAPVDMEGRILSPFCSSDSLEALPAMQLVVIYVGGKSTHRPAIPPRPSTCIQDIRNGSRLRPAR